MGRSYSGPSSTSDRAETSATTSPPRVTVSRSPSTSVATTAVCNPHRSQSASTAASFEGCTIASIRSCDSEVRISNGSMPGSRSGTASRSSAAPIPARAADSLTAHEMPAAPRSCRASSRPSWISSSEASISSFSANGSPIWTEGRDAADASLKVAEASTLAPPMPSRPVAAPYSTIREPTCASLDAEVTRSSARASPTHMTFTDGLAVCGSAKWISPPTVGTPMQLP